MHWLAVAVGFQQIMVGSMPVALWYPSDSPDPWNSAVVRAEPPSPPEEHVIPGAGHMVFTTYCGNACTDWTAPVVAFLNAHLTSP